MEPQPGPLACRALEDALDDYFHGRLAEAARAELEAHAAGCPGCSSVLRMCDELSCQELVAFLDAYLAGELARARRAAFEWHLSICPDCRNYLDSYRRTIALGRAALRGAPEVAVPPELVRAILEARKG